MKNVAGLLLVALFLLSGCSSVPKDWEGLTAFESTFDPEMSDSAEAKTKGLSGPLRVRNYRYEPARIYINGVPCGMVYARSSATFYVNDQQ